MLPELKDEVVVRVERDGVMVERPGVVVGRTIEGKTTRRYDILFPSEKDSLKRLAINVEARNVRKI